MKLKEAIQFKAEGPTGGVVTTEAQLRAHAEHRYETASLPEETTVEEYNAISEVELKQQLIITLYGKIINRLRTIHKGVDLVANDPFRTREEINTLIAQIATGEIDINMEDV